MTSAAPKPQGQSGAPKPEPMPRGGGGAPQHGEDPRGGGGGAYPREEPRGGSRYGGPPPGAQPTPFTTSQRYPGEFIMCFIFYILVDNLIPFQNISKLRMPFK